MRVVGHFDGGARKNVAIAGAGAVVYDVDGRELAARAQFLRGVTVPEAEYTGLILVMATAIELGATELLAMGDAELVVRQVNGLYQCKALNLQPFLASVRAWFPLFNDVEVREFPKAGPKNKRRWGNARADELANMAMNREAHVRER